MSEKKGGETMLDFLSDMTEFLTDWSDDFGNTFLTFGEDGNESIIDVDYND